MGFATDVLALAPSAYWRLDSANWSDAVGLDSSGNARHGLLSGAVQLTPVRPGLLRGADLDGGVTGTSKTANAAVRITTASWMNSSTYSVMVLLKCAAPSMAALVSRRGFNNGYPWTLYIGETGGAVSVAPNGSGSAYAAGGVFLLSAHGSHPATFYSRVASPAGVCDDRTHMVVVTATANGGSTDYRMYLDGAQVDSALSTPGLSVTGDSDMTLLSEWNGSAYDRTIVGTQDETAYWAGTALTTAQISALWSAFVRESVSY